MTVIAYRGNQAFVIPETAQRLSGIYQKRPPHAGFRLSLTGGRNDSYRLPGQSSIRHSGNRAAVIRNLLYILCA
ncbi:hypothetical protein J2T55_000585 [Methylohalomonas lacus]|uniref:Uncharacterized protein n=1 Tax=Methylohalomonas lacus TaxID=398773 RepID=A0AAE3HK39_9GAMM|nr:hypothetical protein [Methylohalomonas lacus]